MKMRKMLGTLLAASVVVASCGSDDESSGSADAAATVEDVELPAEAQEAYDNYVDTLLAADGDAMLDHVTDDFTWLSYGTNLLDAEARADWVTKYYDGFAIAETGEQITVGADDEYIFALAERVTTPMFADGISLVKIVLVDGEWLVEAHRFLGEGEGSG